MKPLYALSAEAAQLQELLEAYADAHDGVVDELPAELAQAIDQSASDIATKVDRIVSVVKEYDARAKARQAAARDLLLSARSDESKATSLKTYLGQCMAQAGAKHWAGGLHEARVVSNGGKRPVVVRVEPADLPMRFQVVSLDADTSAIREALEAGEAVTGCELAPRGTHVRIK
jgi:hypothetical protein